MWCILLGCMLLSACQRAEQYVPRERDADPVKPKEKGETVPSAWRWLPTTESGDTPIVFVADDHDEWADLKGYWNPPVSPEARALAHFGLAPMQAMAIVAATERHFAVKIKVPRGLPDPTPNFPAGNRPTLGKWKLGKALFFERMLPVGDDYYSCASCHDPRHGFNEPKPSQATAMNTLSLINVVYNKRQFWDGRVESLEETVFRSLDDERKIDSERARRRSLDEHVWGGFVRLLVKEGNLQREFKQVFGIEHATQDAVARALATYMRTILAGESLYDRAEHIRQTKGAFHLSVTEFQAALKEVKLAEALQEAGLTEIKTEEIPKRLMQGYQLFHGKARCAQCHAGKLFTDHEFHNVGYKGREGEPAAGVETGRVAQVPIGQKEIRLNGAYRTPSLRNLGSRGIYFHRPALQMLSLSHVVEFYNSDINWRPQLANALKQDGQRAASLGLTKEERDTLVIFLRALEGQPVDPIIMDRGQ